MLNPSLVMLHPSLFRKAQFMTSAPSLAECPEEVGAEVAFAGRSNAGKSSAINKLTQNGKLARTSKTPGRTQLINYFSLGDTPYRLVDLPGYGYAKVSHTTKQQWQKHLSDYLQARHSLKGLILLMDIRHPMQAYDSTMLQWATSGLMPVHILLTKCDKLGRGAGLTALTQIKKQLITHHKMSNLLTIQLFSSHTGEGMEKLQTVILDWFRQDDQSTVNEAGNADDIEISD